MVLRELCLKIVSFYREGEKKPLRGMWWLCGCLLLCQVLMFSYVSGSSCMFMDMSTMLSFLAGSTLALSLSLFSLRLTTREVCFPTAVSLTHTHTHAHTQTYTLGVYLASARCFPV